MFSDILTMIMIVLMVLMVIQVFLWNIWDKRIDREMWEKDMKEKARKKRQEDNKK